MNKKSSKYLNLYPLHVVHIPFKTLFILGYVSLHSLTELNTSNKLPSSSYLPTFLFLVLDKSKFIEVLYERERKNYPIMV